MSAPARRTPPAAAAPAGPVPVSAAAQLHAVRQILGRPGMWLPAESFRAVDAAGQRLPCRRPQAVRFGVLAALVRLAGPEDGRQHAIACLVAAGAKPFLSAWDAEPARTEDEVLALLDAAIGLAARGGP
ncbi:DUF6197 family protein [Lichenibacterium dinghuense]|uniref:DUF6197 family protein n=1 Tax=Lichenibacterium dinghuense TaxID=2895977 RepID=UPI001F216E9E|nr:hypothetical protein [Lichenibacterium sp. 6Y81]